MKVNIDQLEGPKATPAAAEALELVNQVEPDIRKLEKAIMLDPILASTLLRYANSPLMRRSAEISSVPSALVSGARSVTNSKSTSLLFKPGATLDSG